MANGEKLNPFFGAVQAKICQAVAILMMVYHHTFMRPAAGTRVSLLGTLGIETQTAWFGKLCVGTFTIVSGYGLYLSLRGDQGGKRADRLKSSYISVLKRAGRFLLTYWLVFLVFAIPQAVINHATLKAEILGFITIDTRINGGWWYVPQYLCMLSMAPLLVEILNFSNVKAVAFDAIILMAIFAIEYFVFETFSVGWLLFFIEGMLVCRLNLMEKAGKVLLRRKFWRILIGLLLIIAIYIARCLITKSAGEYWFDLFFAPLFVLGLTCLIRKSKPLMWLSGYSTLIWLVHCGLLNCFQGTFDMIRISVLEYVAVLGCSIALSMVLKRINQAFVSRIAWLKK